MNSNARPRSATPASQVMPILTRYGHSRSNLLPMLQYLHSQAGYLSPDAITLIAQHLEMSAHDVFGVATFFSQFRFNPPGRHCLKICEGTACHVRGSAMLLDVITRKLHILPGQTTSDFEFSLERVMCVGSCALAPVVVADDRVCGRANQKTLEKVLSIGITQRTADDARRTQIAGAV
jgi:NADH:ubiquinone oxidoreductase subunit E